MITHDGKEYGGYTDVALRLTLRHGKLFSRQVVFRWYSKRAEIGFPEAVLISQPDGVHQVFDLDQAEKWYSSYVPRKGGRPPRRAAGLKERETNVR